MKALAPNLTVALEELAVLSDIRQKMQRTEGAKEWRKTQTSHSSSIFMYQKRHRHTQRENNTEGVNVSSVQLYNTLSVTNMTRHLLLTCNCHTCCGEIRVILKMARLDKEKNHFFNFLCNLNSDV